MYTSISMDEWPTNGKKFFISKIKSSITFKSSHKVMMILSQYWKGFFQVAIKNKRFEATHTWLQINSNF